MHKNALFLLKNCKSHPALRAANPLASGGCVLCPQTHNKIPHWEILAMPLDLQVYVYITFGRLILQAKLVNLDDLQNQ